MKWILKPVVTTAMISLATLTAILTAALGVSAAPESSPAARCEIRGEEDRKVFVNCPNDLSPRDVLNEVLAIREQKTTPDQTEISIFVFSGAKTPVSTKEMRRISERSLQKIQSAVYSNYPNGETGYFCKKDGRMQSRMQECRELLSKRP